MGSCAAWALVPIFKPPSSLHTSANPVKLTKFKRMRFSFWPCLNIFDTIVEVVEERSVAGSVNKVIILGNVGRDPEIRTSQDGSKFASLAVATSEAWKDKITGERKEKTEWHRIVIFNPQLAEIVEKYVSKGTKLYVEGQLQTRKWQDNTGADRYTTEVVVSRFRGELALLDRRGGDDRQAPDGFSPAHEPVDSQVQPTEMSVDDEIPF